MISGQMRKQILVYCDRRPNIISNLR